MGKGQKRAARVAQRREPQLVEGPKALLLLKGPSSSEILNDAMKDLAALKKPDIRSLSRKNDIRPFEDASSLEFLATKNDCAAFLLASHSKKRPHNLVLGRTFDAHVLDMMELGVVGYEALREFSGPKKMLGAPPCMLFNGDEWDRVHELGKLRSLLLDVFAAKDMTGVALSGIDHVISLTAAAGVVYWRTYFVHLKRGAAGQGRVPRVELAPMGPYLDLVLRRTHFASADLEKASLRKPKQTVVTKEKNVETDVFGEAHGRVHMKRQDFGKLQIKKNVQFKAGQRHEKLLQKRKARGDEAEAGDEAPAAKPAKRARVTAAAADGV